MGWLNSPALTAGGTPSATIGLSGRKHEPMTIQVVGRGNSRLESATLVAQTFQPNEGGSSTRHGDGDCASATILRAIFAANKNCVHAP
jgi:hypothetical protein